jgi:CBS domain-containing protein
MNVASMLKVKDDAIMTARGDQTLRETAQTLAAHNIGALVVTDDSRQVRGIISERDIIRAIADNGGQVLDSSVKTFMTANVVTCATTDTVADLMNRMTQGRFRHVPVVEDGKLIGIISIGDVVKQRIAETELEVEAMRGYIASG